jgi:hypothetical protein
MSGGVVVSCATLARCLSLLVIDGKAVGCDWLIVRRGRGMVSSPVGIGGFEEREFEGYSPAEEVAA